MNRWYENPCTGLFKEDDLVQNVMKYVNEGKQLLKLHYRDPNVKESPITELIEKWNEKSKTEKEYILQTLNHGPMRDKLEVLTWVVIKFPLESFYFIDELITQIDVEKVKQAIPSMQFLKTLFCNYLLPKNRPMFNMKDRPLNKIEEIKNSKSNKRVKNSSIKKDEKVLCFWYFEELLKTRYFRYIKALETFLNAKKDPDHKKIVIGILTELVEKHESQYEILDILVNKLGDSSDKNMAYTYYNLSVISTKHVQLVPKFVRVLRKFIFRPNLEIKAQYYALCLVSRLFLKKGNGDGGQVLNQMKLDETDKMGEDVADGNLAVEIIHIFVGMFKLMLDNGNLKYKKIYSVILNGIARVLPYTENASLQKYVDTIFKLAHMGNIKVAIQSMKLLYAFVTKDKTNQESYQKNFSRFQRALYEILLNPNLLRVKSKVAIIDLTLKSLTNDSDKCRVKAIVKRLLQITLIDTEAEVLCKVLIMLSRFLRSEHNDIFNFCKPRDITKFEDIKVPKIAAGDEPMKINLGKEIDEDDSDCEIIPDIVSDEELDDQIKTVKVSDVLNVKSSWNLHKIQDDSKDLYNIEKRDPQFSNADDTELVELIFAAQSHFHPSVQHFAKTIIKKQLIGYTSDPLEDFSLIALLNKFCNKNCKIIENEDTVENKKNNKTTKQKSKKPKSLSVYSKDFKSMNDKEVPKDLMFFHTFMNFKRGNDVDEEDSDSFDSDEEFEKYLNEKDEFNDEDIEFSDLGEDEDLLSDDELNGLGMDEDMDSVNGDEEVNVQMEEDNLDVESEVEDDEEVNASECEVEDDEEVNASECELEDDEEVNASESEDESDDVTIHSAKRRRLGDEKSDVTISAMKSANKFKLNVENVKNSVKNAKPKRTKSKSKFNSNKSNRGIKRKHRN